MKKKELKSLSLSIRLNIKRLGPFNNSYYNYTICNCGDISRRYCSFIFLSHVKTVFTFMSIRLCGVYTTILNNFRRLLV